jgi:hypothetical protein
MVGPLDDGARYDCNIRFDFPKPSRFDVIAPQKMHGLRNRGELLFLAVIRDVNSANFLFCHDMFLPVGLNLEKLLCSAASRSKRVRSEDICNTRNMLKPLLPGHLAGIRGNPEKHEGHPTGS